MCFNKNIAATALKMNSHRDTIRNRQEKLVKGRLLVKVIYIYVIRSYRDSLFGETNGQKDNKF